MKKPRVFISSTIYDFKDLRSALKYFLEENGFEVVTSENADFQTTNKNNSYQACLDAIETCEYYILLVGSRVGGEYKYKRNNGKTEQITITRAEYKKAYDLFLQGRIKLINFVRSEIYTVKEDREGLKQVLREVRLQTETEEQIKNHESKIVREVGLLFNFLAEIGRNAEMKKANEDDNAEYPAGNWVYQFDSFKDIITVLKNALNLKQDLSKQILSKNIRNEIIKNLIPLTEKNDEKIYEGYANSLIAKEKLKNHNELILTGKELWHLYDFNFIYASAAEHLSNRVLKESLNSDLFFVYDHKKGTYIPTPIYSLINLLIDKIEKAKTLYEMLVTQRASMLEYYKQFNIPKLYHDERLHEVDAFTFSAVINLPYVFKDIVFLSLELIKYLNDNNYTPQLKEEVSSTVFLDTAIAISKERPSFEEIEKILQNNLLGENK